MVRGGDTLIFNTTITGGDAGSARRFEAAIDRAMERRRSMYMGRLGPGL